MRAILLPVRTVGNQLLDGPRIVLISATGSTWMVRKSARGSQSGGSDETLRRYPDAEKLAGMRVSRGVTADYG